MNKRIYLSPPLVSSEEKKMLAQVIDEGWIAPFGPQLDQFESKLEEIFERKRVLALNSGTSALHLSLILAGISKGDEVIVSTFTFAASINAVLYQGATPILMDSEEETWNLDPQLFLEYLKGGNNRPKAIIVTHLYGVPAKIEEIRSICDEYKIILIEDAAEAIGATFNDQPLGLFGDFGVISFNGNKLVTTGGGGALILDEKRYSNALHLATQANKGKCEYLHDTVGYNFRLSNVLAGLGLAQLEKLPSYIEKKREIFNYYRSHLPAEVFTFPSEQAGSISSRWLTTPLINGHAPIQLIEFLEEKNIESRRLWRPLHLQEAYKEFRYVGEQVAENLFEKGICLPSGVGLSKDEQDYIIEQIKQFIGA